MNSYVNLVLNVFKKSHAVLNNYFSLFYIGWLWEHNFWHICGGGPCSRLTSYQSILPHKNRAGYEVQPSSCVHCVWEQSHGQCPWAYNAQESQGHVIQTSHHSISLCLPRMAMGHLSLMRFWCLSPKRCKWYCDTKNLIVLLVLVNDMRRWLGQWVQ